MQGTMLLKGKKNLEKLKGLGLLLGKPLLYLGTVRSRLQAHLVKPCCVTAGKPFPTPTSQVKLCLSYETQIQSYLSSALSTFIQPARHPSVHPRIHPPTKAHRQALLQVLEKQQ